MKSEGEPALVTVDTLSTHVEKPLLNLNAHAQSNWNQDVWVLVFDFAEGVGRSVIADRPRSVSRDEIATMDNTLSHLVLL